MLTVSPLTLGSVRLDSPVLLAPMAGITDRPFRRLARRFGCPLAFSEMIASGRLATAHAATLRMSDGDGEAGPTAVQLAGHDPAVMAEAARVCADRGALLIDINMGCPAKKIVKGWAGAALMRDEPRAVAIIDAVARAVPHLPVTVKMRAGWDADHRTAPRLARLAEERGARLITVHGRTRDQFYGGRADWAVVGEVKAAVSIPVIGNGDVTSADDARALMAATGADGVMIGRAAQGRPWLLGHVARALATGGAEPPPPDPITRGAIALEHFDALLDHYGAFVGLRVARKHMAWATQGLRAATALRRAVNTEDDPDRARDVLAAFWATAQVAHPAESTDAPMAPTRREAA
ncbi:tRNA dihydrouridine synthase DusB [Roseospira visakhapatnamensis]|uniref:tRNA-dihydrouridine synthase n=1 Tax=Roseospira visakhapatnamensis TaxID=390880 RepID=A0A7W6RBD4_9PROT|nr:tRNA dihydrouridine synthase DusB [Roseospira visakhapatnamensis]MBB4265342.1 tRNA-dihydrouridine synthase B [Roseospira visakhapatnamensis]